MPVSARPAIPKLRLHKASGKAAVMLDGRYLYLGPFGTARRFHPATACRADRRTSASA